MKPDAETAAQELLRAFHAHDTTAIERVHEQLPQVSDLTLDEVRGYALTIREAGTVIARENGYKSFGALRLAQKLEARDYGEALDRFKALVHAGDAAELEALLSANPKLPDTLDDPHFEFASTALIILKDNLDAVDALLRHGADINAKSQWWAGEFHILEVASAETAKALVQRGAEINAHAAAEQGWLDWLEARYEVDPSIVNQRGGDGKTPLHYADDPAVMDWLLARGADLEARDIDHRSTPLQWKIGDGKLDSARELVKRGAVVDVIGAVVLGDKALVEAALDRHPHAVRVRVNDPGYDLMPRADGSHQYVYAFNAAGLSPFQVAIECGQREIFDFMLSRADAETQLLAYCAAADSANAHRIAQRHPTIVTSLAQADQRQLINAAWTGKADVVALMIELGFNLHIYDDDKMMPLHSAAFHGFHEVIKLLLEADDEPPLDWLNGYGGTALGTCLFGWRHGWRDDGDHAKAIRLLVEAGSDVRSQWLPTGDAAIDASLQSGLDAKG